MKNLTTLYIILYILEYQFNWFFSEDLRWVLAVRGLFSSFNSSFIPNFFLLDLQVQFSLIWVVTVVHLLFLIAFFLFDDLNHFCFIRFNYLIAVAYYHISAIINLQIVKFVKPIDWFYFLSFKKYQKYLNNFCRKVFP